MIISTGSTNYDVFCGGGQIEYCGTEKSIIYSQYGDNIPVQQPPEEVKWESGGALNIRDWGFTETHKQLNSSSFAEYTIAFNTTIFNTSKERAQVTMDIYPPSNFRLTGIKFMCNGGSTSAYIGKATLYTSEGTFYITPSSSTQDRYYYETKEFPKGVICEKINLYSKHSNPGSYGGLRSHSSSIEWISGYFLPE